MNTQKIFATFILSELYYLPVYEPVAELLKKNNKNILFLVREKYSKRVINTRDLAISYLDKKGYEYRILESDLSDIETKFAFFSANGFRKYDFNYHYTVLMSHGIGTKGGYFIKEHTNFDLRFVEGSFREKKMNELYPEMNTTQYNVGFAKLDPAVNIKSEEKSKLIEQFGLDPEKKTLLYSPTFYPSSIQRIKKDFPKDFAEYNIIIKPHAFSYEMRKYWKHRRLFKYWAKFNNVYFAPISEFNLVPFMAIADVMVTDESSAMFEFMALKKPVIVYRDVKLRLTYRLNPQKLKRRMEDLLIEFQDKFNNIYSYSELYSSVKEAISNPNSDTKKNEELVELLVGKTDGKVSERIVAHLNSFKNE